MVRTGFPDGTEITAACAVAGREGMGLGTWSLNHRGMGEGSGVGANLSLQ